MSAVAVLSRKANRSNHKHAGRIIERKKRSEKEIEGDEARAQEKNESHPIPPHIRSRCPNLPQAFRRASDAHHLAESTANCHENLPKDGSFTGKEQAAVRRRLAVGQICFVCAGRPSASGNSSVPVWGFKEFRSFHCQN